jgi:hypothetical protein
MAEQLNQPEVEQPNVLTEQPNVLMEPPNKNVHKFKLSYVTIILDYILRWALYAGWQFNYISGSLLWIGQAAIIPVIVLIVLVWRHATVGKRYPEIDASEINTQATLWSFIIILFTAFLGSYITYSLYPTWGFWTKFSLASLIFIAYGIYMLALVAISVRMKPEPQSSTATEAELTDDEWRDENDRLIIKLETDKLSLSQRVEAYTLESALFGALGFSGFVTIIASEKPVLQGVHTLLEDISKVFTMGINLEFRQIAQVFPDIMENHTLIAAIAVQTLISSMFFLSVIIARLRFNDVLRRVDYAIRLASSYNDKEEDLLLLALQESAKDKMELERRMQNVKTKISESIYHAEQQSWNGLVPIVKYMSISRNLGVISFLLILITSALWVSKVMAIIFTAMSVLGYVYPSFDRWLRDRNLSDIVFFQRGIKFFPHLTRHK